MAEPDHLVQALPESAKPIMADRLLELEERQRRNALDNGKEERIKTGCLEIDDYVLCGAKDRLNGGFERGIVVGISAANGDEYEGRGSRLISLQCMASVLIAHLATPYNPAAPKQTPKVIVVDTTGSFPLALLVNVLKTRLLKSRQQSKDQDNTTGNFENTANIEEDEDLEKKLNTMLRLVAISRVFDIEGLWEVLSEMGQTSDLPDNEEVDPEAYNSSPPWTDESAEQNTKVVPEERHEVGDSEDEDADSETHKTPPPLKPHPPSARMLDDGPELLIIDNMHYLISHLFTHAESSSAHNLLSLLSRTLHTLTHARNVLTILHNSTTSTKANYSDTNNTRQPQPSTIRSVFTSTSQKPSLGRVFDQFPDLHVMISKVPKHREDAETLYRHAEDTQNEYTVNNSLVFEVLRDECPILGKDKDRGKKFADREQRWGLFEISAEGTDLVDALEGGVAGNMKGMALSKGDGGRDVSSVTKLYGFGGKRV